MRELEAGLSAADVEEWRGRAPERRRTSRGRRGRFARTWRAARIPASSARRTRRRAPGPPKRCPRYSASCACTSTSLSRAHGLRFATRSSTRRPSAFPGARRPQIAEERARCRRRRRRDRRYFPCTFALAAQAAPRLVDAARRAASSDSDSTPPRGRPRRHVSRAARQLSRDRSDRHPEAENCGSCRRPPGRLASSTPRSRSASSAARSIRSAGRRVFGAGHLTHLYRGLIDSLARCARISSPTFSAA